MYIHLLDRLFARIAHIFGSGNETVLSFLAPPGSLASRQTLLRTSIFSLKSRHLLCVRSIGLETIDIVQD